jgi:IS5 family transposase
MIYRKIISRLLEEFEKETTQMKTKGGRGGGAGTVYTHRAKPYYGESEARRVAREEERERKNKLNKEDDSPVKVSKKFKEKKEININELKKLIRSILNDKG